MESCIGVQVRAGVQDIQSSSRRECSGEGKFSTGLYNFFFIRSWKSS